MNAVGVVATPARTPARKDAFTRGEHGVGAAVGVEALDVEPERLGARPQVRVLEPALVGEQRVVHRPERALQGGRLGRTGRRPGARVRGAHRELPETQTDVQRAQARVERRAVRALVVAVDDDQAPAPPHVVGVADRRQRGGAEVAQDSASKIRLAPGSTPGFSAS